LNPLVPVTLSAAYKTEGIRPSWPPRSRTERYCLIRAAPSTGWVAATDLARHLGARFALAITPPFEAGSEAHSRRTLTCQERKVRVSSPAAARTAPGFQGPLPRRRRTFHRGTRRFRPPPLARPAAFGAAPATRQGLVPGSSSPARCEQAGDGRGRRIRIPRQLAATRFPAGASRLAGSSSKSGRRSIRSSRCDPRIA
jgi:hypothetical protein